MEDGKKLDGVIPKIPQCDITQNDVDRIIGLRDFEMMKLADGRKRGEHQGQQTARCPAKRGSDTPGMVPNPKADEDRS